MNHINDSIIYEPHPLSDVELLGCAKNDIAEVEEMVLSLPYECWIMLSLARELLNRVQEYLYNR